MMDRSNSPDLTPEERVERVASLDVLIDYRRRELDLSQTRIDRAETQAAGLIAAALAAGGVAITLLKSVGAPLSTVPIVLAALGALCLILAILVAFSSRDPQTRMSMWFEKVVRGPWLRHTEEILRTRRAFARAGTALSRSLICYEPVTLREQISDSLAKRIDFGLEIAEWRDNVVRLSALFLVSGTVLLLLAGVMTAAGI